MNNEIIIGSDYTSILKTITNTSRLERSCEYGENNDVPHLPLIRNRTIRTNDFLNKLSSNLSQNNEVLPAGCKFFKRIGGRYKLYIIEETPKIRTIKVDTGVESTIEKLRKTGKLKEYGYENYLSELTSDERSPYKFQLSFPYVVFIIVLNDKNEMCFTKPFFRLHPITSLNDYLFKAPLYNIPNSQEICLGGVRNFNTVYETIENIIETFWLNRYNHDYTNNIKAYEESEAYEVQDYLTWMYHTKTNPMFIYNVPWITYSKNIGQVISRAEENYSSSSGITQLRYSTLFDAAKSSTSVQETTSSDAKNISLSLSIDGGIVSVGDEILFEDKTYYLYSLKSSDEGYSYESIELEDSDGIIMSVPFDDFENGYKSIFKPNFLEEATVSGKLLKPGTIISCDAGGYTIYKKITGLRRAFDGGVEAIIGTDHYLIENIDFNIIDIDNIRINGERLDDKTTYYMIDKADSYSPNYYLKELKFDTININNSGEVTVRFKDTDNNLVRLDMNEYENDRTSKKFINKEELVEEQVFFNFDTIFKNYDRNHPIKCIKNKGMLYERGIRINSFRPLESDRSEIVKRILIEDDKRLKIPGTLVDLDFKVGDPIVYADWESPENMLHISIIDKFLIEDDELFVCSTTLNKQINFKIPFVNFNNYKINIGVIRKVESSCGNWKSGDKIKASTPGITNFPKKDTNTIIAFINDGGTKYPLALCSNLCTIWMKDGVEDKFKLIPHKSKLWFSSEAVPFNTEKIKWQHGDSLCRRGNVRPTINFLTRRGGTQYGFEYNYISNIGGVEWGTSVTKNTLSEYYSRHGFIMPRTAVSSPVVVNRKGFPNMLGGYVIDSGSRIHIRSEQLKEDF